MYRCVSFLTSHKQSIYIHFCCAPRAPKAHPYLFLNCFEASQSQIFCNLPKLYLHPPTQRDSKCRFWRIL